VRVAKHASDSVNRKGGDAKSQFHAGRLTKSMDKIRAQEDGRVDELPVTLTGPGRLKDNVFPLEAVDAKVVEKLAGEAAAKEHLGLDDVSHIVVTIQPDSGKPGISVFLSNQRFWRAALDGSGLSNPDQQARAAIDGARKAVSGLETAAPKAATAAPKTGLSACLSAAGTDAAKLTACTR
jgi:hypothetical protein